MKTTSFNEFSDHIDKWCGTQIKKSKIIKDNKSLKSLKNFKKIHQKILEEVTHDEIISSDDEVHFNEIPLKKTDKKNKLAKSVATNIHRSKILKAIELLDKPKKKEKADRLLDFCTKRKKVYKPDLTMWDSAIYLVRNIRQCIIKQDWKPIPDLLLTLMKCPLVYSTFVKEISYLTLIAYCDNTVSQHILDDFRDFCFVNVAKDPDMCFNEFEVWYKELSSFENLVGTTNVYKG